ncbi:hypothetical protein DFH11DRAFT_323410 [Phellopilus nigrolimitatus]|nr:hypothetical protein DFH11DRAFT_323410 [Phellopilus nigrolimitatus]
MQCIWTSTSSVLRRRACPAATTLRFAQPAQRRNISFNRFVSDAGKARFASLADAFVSTAIRDTAIAPVPLPVLDLPREDRPCLPNKMPTSRSLPRSSPAPQRSPSASRAKSTPPARPFSSSRPFRPHSPSTPRPSPRECSRLCAVRASHVDFGQAVSPRLALHSLLHGLVRRGMTKKAGRVAWQLLRGGVPVHERTLACVTGALCSSDVAALRDAGFREQLRRARATLTLPGPEPLDMKALKPLAPCTRLAFQLFAAARQLRAPACGADVPAARRRVPAAGRDPRRELPLCVPCQAVAGAPCAGEPGLRNAAARGGRGRVSVRPDLEALE